MVKIKDGSLYLILTEECSKGRSAIEIAERAITGGIDMLQMREKTKPHDELVNLGRELCKLCKMRGVRFIVNDDPLLAKEVDADGVHLGQEDLKKFNLAWTRKSIGYGKIFGVSTHSLGEFEEANDQDFDYIAYGPVFPTKTKDYCIGTKDAARVLETAKKPVIFIGGINLNNVDQLLSLGAKNIALIRGITEADDITLAARSFKDKIGLKREGMHETKDKR